MIQKASGLGAQFIVLLFLGAFQISVYSQNEPNPILPDTIFISLGNTIEIYNDNVAFVQLGNSSYTFQWEYEVGHSDSKKWYWTGNLLGSFNLKFKCYFDGALYDEASTIINVLEKESGSTYTLLSIGNSLTAGGFSYQFDKISNDTEINLHTIGTRGDLIKHEGHGGWEFITFLDTKSPFYFDGFDIAQYISTNGFPVPDIIRISLGINDCYQSDSMSFVKQTADDLVGAIRKDFPESLILIALPTLCENSGAGWISNYGDLTNYERYQLRIRELWNHLLYTYSNSNGSILVQVTYDGLCIDRDDGYPKNNNGDHTNGVHPNPLGYSQLSRGFSNVLNRYSKIF